MSEWTANAEAVAAAKGYEIKRPASDELFIDIDDADSLKVFHTNLAALGSLVSGFVRTPSPSGMDHRFHVRVKLSRDVAGETERIALQALLGSDRLHETLSWLALSRGATGVTLFFEKPTAAPPAVATVVRAQDEIPY